MHNLPEVLLVIRRVPSYQNPALACDDLMGTIEVKRGDGGTSDCGYTDDQETIVTPAEMFRPALRAGIIKVDDLAALRIRDLKLCALPLIALATRAPKISSFGQTAGCNRQNVLNAQWAAGNSFVTAAVATAMTGVGKNLCRELNRNIRTAHVVGTGSCSINGGV